MATYGSGLTRLPDMNVEVASPRGIPVCMLLALELDRNRNKPTMTHAALGDDMPSKVLDIAQGPS